jgi:Kef-type K+ transport system membrane component KefB
VGLIIAGIGRAQGVIPDSIFSALITMSIATTLLAPPVLKWLYRVWPEHREAGEEAVRPEVTRSEPVRV